MDSSTPNAPGLLVTPRTTLGRHPERGSHERAVVDAILDEALVCHVAVALDGAARVLPTAHVRIGEALYLHGARKNRLLCALAGGLPACVTVTLVDGLVFARSALHHSMNYRSAVLYGAFREVSDGAEKRAALAALIDHMAQDRSEETRAPSDAELQGTLVVKLPILEASAKVRSGPPLDAERDLDNGHWAGVVPLALSAGTPVPDPRAQASAAPCAAVEARAHALAPSQRLPRYERVRGDVTLSTDPARLDFAYVHRFLAEESYWAQGIAADVQRRAMQHSLCFGLYRGARQIGFARVLTDYGRLGYLGDVFVEQGSRGQGLGTWLVEQVLAHPALAGVDRFLLGTKDAHALYARLGFVPAEPGRYMLRRHAL